MVSVTCERCGEAHECGATLDGLAVLVDYERETCPECGEEYTLSLDDVQRVEEALGERYRAAIRGLVVEVLANLSDAETPALRATYEMVVAAKHASGGRL